MAGVFEDEDIHLGGGYEDEGVGGVGEPAHCAIPFAGGDGDYSVLSILNGAHSIGEGILGFLTMNDSNALRVVCKKFRGAVMDFPWMNSSDESRIRGSLRAWRAAFPAARAVNVSGRVDIIDSYFVHIRGGVAVVQHHTVKI